jgi:DNA-binding transcriptional LysR family regulator
VDGAVSLIAAVESGQGIGFAPATFIRAAGRRVKFVNLSPAAPSLRLGYVVRLSQRSETPEKFLEALRSVSSGPDRGKVRPARLKSDGATIRTNR